MNQEKIGKFIVQNRKNKKMTQQELAYKLGVSDRTIGNWENGRNMPDVSLFKPLCEILDITVNELVNGEKIATDNVVTSSEETIIKALDKNKKDKKKFSYIIRLLFIILIILMGILFIVLIYYQNAYPEIDIYNFSVLLSDSDDKDTLKRQFVYDKDNFDIYYYGVDSVELCDAKENCYWIKTALDYKQTNINNIKSFFESQFVLGNVNRYMLYDGGTTIYSDDSYSVIFCNTLEGNKDIYIGSEYMVKELNGSYCGHDENTTKSFIRTYHVISSVEDNDEELINVTLKQFQGDMATIQLSKDYNIVPGNNYEFSFYTYYSYEDTIKNIFENSTLVSIKETDKVGLEQINEDIYVNNNEDDVELNELDNVTMKIKDNSLTKTGASIIINDYSGYKYIYGSSFRIDKMLDDEWKELESICTNCGFTSMAYGPDINGRLTFDLDWEKLYGKLEKGRYRIVKDVVLESDTPCNGSCEDYYISVEFTID